MKSFLLIIIVSILSLNCSSFSTKAQIRATSNGQVTNTNTNPKSDVKTPAPDISTIDFKNFTYPDLFAGKTDRTFTLKNGQSGTPKLPGQRIFALRKTYFFDITGDGENEAITQILTDGCGEGCDSHSLFYVHTIENNQPKLIWKIATGAEALGGLKSVAFKNKSIILETFGNSAIQDSLVNTIFDTKLPKSIIPTNYTRFVFSLTDKMFTQTDKEVLPLTDKTIAGYRAQISFGEQD
jgi:hypothetical protein